MELRELRGTDRQWRIGLMNGANMSNLGGRDKRLYGSIDSIQALENQVKEFGEQLGVEVFPFVSNHEGDFLEHIHATAADRDAYIVNPAGFTIWCEATRHAFQESRRPVIEVHFSNYVVHGITSALTKSVMGLSMGLRQYGYVSALLGLTLALDDETFLGTPDTPTETNRPDGLPWKMAGR